MDEIYIGLVVIVMLVGIYRLNNLYHKYKQTLYPVNYSGFFEFMIRQKSEKKLSESYWFNNNFGKHKIIYHVERNHYDIPFKFEILILKSGIYIISDTNLSDDFYIDDGNKVKLIGRLYDSETKRYMEKDYFLQALFLDIKRFEKRVVKMIDYPVEQVFATVVKNGDLKLDRKCSKGTRQIERW